MSSAITALPDDLSVGDVLRTETSRTLDEVTSWLGELTVSYERQELLHRLDEAILRSTVSLGDVLELIVNQGVAQTNSQHGQVVEYRGSTLVVAASTEPARVGTELPMQMSLSGTAMRRGRDLYVGDTSRVGDGRIVVFHADTKSELAIRIRHANSHRALGVLNLEASEQDAYSLTDAAFARSLAAQLAIAFQQSRERTTSRRLTDVIVSLTAGLVPPSAGYVEILDSVLSAVDASHGQLLEWTGADFLVVASSQQRHVGSRVPADISTVGKYVLKEGGRQLLYIPSIQESPYSGSYLAMLHSRGSRMISEVIVPLAVEGRLVGALNIESRHADAFSEFELSLLQSLQWPLALAVQAASSQLGTLRRTRTDSVNTALASAGNAAHQLLHLVSGDVSVVRANLIILGSLLDQSDRPSLADGTSTTALLDMLIKRLDKANLRVGQLRADLDPQSSRFSLRVIDLSDVCLRVLNEAEARYETVHFRFDGALLRGRPSWNTQAPLRPITWADDQIEDLVSNLVDNAAHAVTRRWGRDRRGRVKVQLDIPDMAHVRLRVFDNGTGIPPESVPSLFGYGMRGDGGAMPGSGIGLWWCRQYLLQHDGSISVEPGWGTGAIFIVNLPLARGVAPITPEVVP